MVSFLAWGNVPNSFVVANGSLLEYQNLPADYEGKFKNNEWNAMQLQAFHTGPKGYHWARTPNDAWSARCPNDMVPFLHTQLITVGSDGLARAGRGRATFVAFAPNGIGWFIRYDSQQCIYGDPLSSYPSTFQALVRELENTHPRKDECIDFVAFGQHDMLLVRFENGNSHMALPEDPAVRSQISQELIAEVQSRLQAGWTLGNRTTLCEFDTNRWFIEWKRGTMAEFRYSMGIGQTQDLETAKRVLSGVGSDAGLVARNETNQLIAANSAFAQQYALSRIL
ncbi:hypothetical protein PV11_09996 [Exophiala sideris]|uniref:Uncharacterized protein n=2 Tax=Exophiala sideris TaxID=1016849 RepID=A0A0D1YTN2_9EURO|nr:hypothetical protein PV11_09996 [Exophiala sideris]